MKNGSLISNRKTIQNMPAVSEKYEHGGLRALKKQTLKFNFSEYGRGFSKKLFAVLIILILISGILNACNEKRNGIFSLELEQAPECLDPQIISNTSEALIINHCFEGLMRLNEVGEPVPAVAESYTVSDDGLIHTFKIRRDAFWHISQGAADLLGDNLNSTVTAHDFVFALRRVVSPQTGSSSPETFFSILNAAEINSGQLSSQELGVTATDNYTLVITLTAPDPALLVKLSYSAAMPCNEAFFNATGGRYGRSVDMLITNGGMIINSWRTSGSVTMSKNPVFHSFSSVKSDSIKLTIQPDAAARIESFNEELTNTLVCPSYLISSVDTKSTPTIRKIRSSALCVTFNSSKNPFSSDSVRLALCHAIDSASLDIPDYAYPVQASDTIPTADSELARKYLSEFGEEQIAVLEQCTLLCPDTPELKLLAKEIVQSWQRVLGIYMNVEAVETDIFSDRVSDSDYTIALLSVSSPVSSDISSISSENSSEATSIEGSYLTAIECPVCELDTYFVCSIDAGNPEIDSGTRSFCFLY